MLFGSVIGGPMLYKTPTSRSSKIFAKRVFWRLRNQILDGHISGLEQDRDNLKPLLPTKSPTPYRLVPLASRSRDHTTSGLAFLASRSHVIVFSTTVWRCVAAKPKVILITFMPLTVRGRPRKITCVTIWAPLAG